MHHVMGHSSAVASFSDSCVAPTALCSILFDVSFRFRLCTRVGVHSCVQSTVQASRSYGYPQKDETDQ